MFRGGLTHDTLETLLEGESGTTADEASHYDYYSEEVVPQARTAPKSLHLQQHNNNSPVFDDTAVSRGLHPHMQPRVGFYSAVNYGQPDPSVDNPGRGDEDQKQAQRVPVHEQRTILIANLSEHTTHKDLAGIVRGGRLLDIFVRNDRTATVSFVEGAAEFLAYTKRNDIYLHTKRVSPEG